MKKNDDRSRRGKVGHLRDVPPHDVATLCGVEADSGRIRIVRSGEWLALGELQCSNCRRELVRGARSKAEQQSEAHDPECADGQQHP